MRADAHYREHWLDADPDRLEAHETMFRWRPEMEPLLAPAELAPDQVVVD